MNAPLTLILLGESVGMFVHVDQVGMAIGTTLQSAVSVQSFFLWNFYQELRSVEGPGSYM